MENIYPWLFKEGTPNEIFEILLFVLDIVDVIWPFFNKFISLYLISSKEKLHNAPSAVIEIYLKFSLSLELRSVIKVSLYWLYIVVGIVSKVGSTNTLFGFWPFPKFAFWALKIALLLLLLLKEKFELK